jgi:hypothetical protein
MDVESLCIKNIIGRRADTYLTEIQSELYETLSITCDTSTLWRRIQKAGLSHKVLTREVAERNEEDRRHFWEYLYHHQITSRMIVNCDEMGFNLHSTNHARGYAEIGQAAYVEDAFIRGEKLTLIGAVTLDGMLAYMIIEEAATSDIMIDFVANHVVRK